jgi:thiol-disulfide isomerase/thioredoxin
VTLIAAGAAAPPFSLPSIRPDAHAPVTLADVSDDGARPVVLAFFKANCPVCQMAFPLYGELERVLAPAGVPVVAIAQEPPAAARPWLAERSFEGEAVTDAGDDYAVSDAYGIRTVPTLVLVAADGTVADVVEGWDRDRTNAIAARFSAPPVSTPDDGLPAFRPG